MESVWFVLTNVAFMRMSDSARLTRPRFSCVTGVLVLERCDSMAKARRSKSSETRNIWLKLIWRDIIAVTFSVAKVICAFSCEGA